VRGRGELKEVKVGFARISSRLDHFFLQYDTPTKLEGGGAQTMKVKQKPTPAIRRPSKGEYDDFAQRDRVHALDARTPAALSKLQQEAILESV